mgnify:FL=1
MLLQPLQNNSGKSPTSRSGTIPAPVKGWNAKDALADMDEEFAIELENVFPNMTDVEVRGGYASHSTGNGSGAVETLIEYAGPSTHKLISAAGSVIYDSTAAGGSTAIATGKSNARWQTTMFGTGAGNFLFMVNGEDAPIYYNGSSFTTPSLASVTATDIVHVTAHQRRLFFTFNDSLVFGYLPVVSVAGTVATFDVGGLCKKGGKIQACGSWTRDGGSGPDDIFVIITSEGECVLYNGTDPSSATAWSFVGVFSIGKPIGRRCIEKVGAELIVITQDGAVPLSVFLPIDQVASSSKSLSDNIRNEFLASARLYSAIFGWQSVHYPQGSYALFNIPVTATVSHQYVVNTQTGAWAKFTNQDAACWATYDGDLYFGATTGGVIFKADTGTSDNTANVEWKIRPAFSYFGTRGRQKLFSLCRPHFTSSGSPSYAIDLNVNFSNINPTSIPTPPSLSTGIWDVSKWDSGTWADVAQISSWNTVYGLGECASPTIRGGDSAIEISFSAYDMIWQPGNAL